MHTARTSLASLTPAASRLLSTAIAALVFSACAGLAFGALAASARTGTGGKLRLHKPSLRTSQSGAANWACPSGACDAIVIRATRKRTAGARMTAGSGERLGLDPQDLQSAYDIPPTLATSRKPLTVAVVDAFGYPDAEKDLSAYRARYGLPACTKKKGCLKVVNEAGEKRHLPKAEPGWDVEAALDADMVSAACPQCHILMVEASTELPADLGESVNTAARLGAAVVSNSYGYPELDEEECSLEGGECAEVCGKAGCSQYNADYTHPGTEIFASAGDSGYGDTFQGFSGSGQDNFPASSPNVVAVGGTALFKIEALPRKWFEEAWGEPLIEIGTGSGCSLYQEKPSWQKDTGCARRTDNDVSAVAAAISPVSVRYDGTWIDVAGTSVASPLVAGIEAHASPQVREEGARAFYEDPAAFNDVTQGFDWNTEDESGLSECAPNEYLCTAQVGYDGPTGIGTPHGVPLEGGGSSAGAAR